MGEACGRAEGGRRSRSVREWLFVWLRGMSASLPILQPHLGATSPEHSHFLCMSTFLSLFVPFSLSLSLSLISLSVFWSDFYRKLYTLSLLLSVVLLPLLSCGSLATGFVCD